MNRIDLQHKMRIVTIYHPMTGGVYSVVLAMRRALADAGVDLTWLAAGKSLSGEIRKTANGDDFSFGAIIATQTDDDGERARSLVDYITESGASVVVLHALTGPVEMNIARYLPPTVRRVLIVHTITVATYQAARAVRDWVHAAVCVSPRIADDLVKQCGYDPAWTVVIPNGLDVDGFRAKTEKTYRGPLRVLSLGRVDHSSKGVLWIPEIIGRALAAGVELEITIAGSGPDLLALKRECRRAGIDHRTQFLGDVERSAVPGIMRSHDVFLFSSIYEGLGITLIEAMAAGCVPVASRIRGVTDFIINDGNNGLLFEVGDAGRAAHQLIRLCNDHQLLTRLRLAGESRAQDFNLSKFGSSYAQLLKRVEDTPRSINLPLPISSWSLPSGMTPGLRRFLPAGVKGYLRIARERVRGFCVRL